MLQVLVTNLGLDLERVQPTQMRAPTKLNRFNRINEKKIETPGNCDLSFILNLVILGPTKWIVFLLFFQQNLGCFLDSASSHLFALKGPFPNHQ